MVFVVRYVRGEALGFWHFGLTPDCACSREYIEKGKHKLLYCIVLYCNTVVSFLSAFGELRLGNSMLLKLDIGGQRCLSFVFSITSLRCVVGSILLL